MPGILQIAYEYLPLIVFPVSHPFLSIKKDLEELHH
jgi:hypothetical protein